MTVGGFADERADELSRSHSTHRRVLLVDWTADGFADERADECADELSR